MRLRSVRWEALLALALLNPGALCDNGSNPGDQPPLSISLPHTPEVCESRTINYITHTLPQQCLRTSWTSSAWSGDSPATQPTHSAASQTPAASPEAERPPRSSDSHSRTERAQETDGHASQGDQRSTRDEEDHQEELATSSFLSFEEWKEMMLKKAGQDSNDLRGRRLRERGGDRDAAIGIGGLDSLGDDGEIQLDFDALSDKVSELTTPGSGTSSEPDGGEAQEERLLYDDGKTQYYRSKDAGKTSKERFSYSSFDAGATMLKTSPGAKNPKAILVENKDSYMLLECHAADKFVVVELSDDILIDTVVLANFEFFSSMIRKFRVSVSARYPVKQDKWIELGTYEARNSRDIQPFLVEHPQIYTKYIRIDFLSHYGTEYYCPVSLLRVHGTRMIDSWKEPEGADDAEEPIDSPTPETASSASQTDDSVEPPRPSEEGPDDPAKEESSEESSSAPMGLTPWHQPPQWEPFFDVCPTGYSATAQPTPVYSASGVDDDKASAMAAGSSTSVPAQATQAGAVPSSHPLVEPGADSRTTPSASTPPSSSHSPAKVSASNSTSSPSASVQRPSTRADATEPSQSTASAKAAPPAQSAAASKNRTGTSTSQQSSPTVQESFFKTVTKRLQLLESNTSLSLQYIEDQSRFLQEALQKMEKKQISRVDAFLDGLNKTVLTELRTLRGQYDQIWQSTVIALETQREQSQREIVALSSRLNLLADEVVFQKRMAILQSVLLLSCLVLVIFSRGYVGSGLELVLQQQQHQRFHHRRQRSGIIEDALAPSPNLSDGEYAPVPPAQARGLQPMYGAPRREKTLPLTPMSEYPPSRDASPSADAEEAREVSRFTRNTPPRDEEGSGDAQSSHKETGDVEEALHRARYQNAPGVDADGVPLSLDSTITPPGSLSLSHSNNNTRKPLPALPEDSPEDPS